MNIAKIIPFSEWQVGIAPLWSMEDRPHEIPIINNPFQIIQYPLADWPEKVCFLPIEYSEDGVVKGYTSMYNISDSVLRIRGIYVLPEHRGQGVGHRMWQEAATAYPETFYRVTGFWREDSAPKFIQHSGMTIVPATGWIWSDFSKVNMRFLYKDRRARPNGYELLVNQDFLREMAPQYGYGGSNNLNKTWTKEEWLEFAEPHAYAYKNTGLPINFF